MSDWSSDVCSSDLGPHGRRARDPALALAGASVSARRRRGSVAVSEDSGVPQRRVQLDRQGAGQHFGARADRRPRETSVEPRDEDVRERSEEHTSELQSLMRISYAVFCLKKKKTKVTSNKIKQEQN